MINGRYVAVSALLVLCSCSSIIEGRSQEIVINTNPSGATCTLIRNEISIGSVSPTPGAVLIEKTKYDILVKCNKGGYQEATYFNKSGVAGATVGNIILGGGIGWAIDSSTGSDNKYDSPINITLVPEEKGSTHQHTSGTQTPANAAFPPQTSEPASSASDFPNGKNGSR